MNQEFDNVDKFLRNASFNVEDNGFSDRVLQSLPRHAEWERKLQRIWQLVCLTAAIIIGWWTNVLDIFMTDLKVFFHTLPLNYDVQELFLMATLPIFIIMVTIVVWNKKIIY